MLTKKRLTHLENRLMEERARAQKALGLFDEMALYGTLTHVVGEDVGAHRARIEAALREAGVEIRSMEIIAPSLEDVFIASVRERGRSYG